jgi:hypothetical protein
MQDRRHRAESCDIPSVSEMPTLGVLDHLESSLKDPFTSLLVLEVIYFLRSNMKHRPEDIGLSPPVS